MIIYGSRMYGKKNVVTGFGSCDHCGAYGKLTSYNARKWGHIYFIPLIPEGPHVRVVKECKACGRGMHVPVEKVAATIANLRASMDRALAALAGGQAHFQGEGDREQISCAGFLSGTVDLLYCLQADEHVEQLLSSLREGNHQAAYQLVTGSIREFGGEPDAAGEAYVEAAKAAPDDPLPVTMLGDLCFNRKDLEKAQAFYERARELAPEGLSVLQSLLGVYEARKDHEHLAETYERIFDLVPELRADKKLFKAYKKACKNAGRQPVGG
jgi:tetratricopeptide (TPR) repeat protein